MVSGYQKWVGKNAGAFRNTLAVFVKAQRQQFLEILFRAAQNFVGAVNNGTLSIPVYTGNLKDSTGVAIYDNGVLQQYLPTKTATKKQNMGGGFIGVKWSQIDGRDFLVKSIAEGATTFIDGIWFVVYAAVPYAYKINTEGSPKGRGRGFFNDATRFAENEIFTHLRPM